MAGAPLLPLSQSDLPQEVERSEIEGGWQFKILKDFPKEFRLAVAEFPAVAQTVYTVRGKVVMEGDSPGKFSAKIVWRSEAGVDAAEKEHALGQPPSTLVPEILADDSWLAIGMSGRGEVKKGSVELLLPALTAGTVLTVKDVSAFVGAEEKARADSVSSAESVREADAQFAFTENLLPPIGGGRWEYSPKTLVPELPANGYTNEPHVVLSEANDRGSWLSPQIAIDPAAPIYFSYWTRFSTYARMGFKPSPVQFEFFKKDDGGKFVSVPWEKKLSLDGNGMLSSLYGQWFPYLIGPVMPPEGANAIRVRVIYEKEVPSWGAEPVRPNWGELHLDGMALWQGVPDQSVKIPGEWTVTPYGGFFFGENRLLPPFVPVGTMRDNSIAMFPVRGKTANLFFADDGGKPNLQVRVGNLLAVPRTVSLENRVLDWLDKPLEEGKIEVSLAPYEVKTVDIPVAVPVLFGAYMVELKAREGELTAGEAGMRFAWLRHPTQPDEVRMDPNYPFDMHPTRITADPEGSNDTDEIDFQIGIARLMGVQNIRLQSRFYYYDKNSSEASREGARRKVERWRDDVLPAMKKYNVGGWVSLMEQGRSYVPHNEKELEAWYAYNNEQIKAFGKDVKFFIFGNEAQGGHAPDGDDDSLWQSSNYEGTNRDWMNSYVVARQAAKDADPQVLFGPGQASDRDGSVARRFFRMLGDKAQYDIWSYNAYGNSANMGVVIAKEIEKQKRALPMGVLPEVGLSVPAYGKNRVSGERSQAITVVQTYLDVLSRAPWVKRIGWFILQGGRGVDSHFLFDFDWTPRPSVVAYMVLADTLRAGRVESQLSWPGGTELLLWRRTDGSLVGVGWSAVHQQVTLDVGVPRVEVSDIFGNRKTVETKGNLLTLTLDAEPMYLLGAEKIEESKLFEISVQNVTETAGPKSRVSVRVKNNTTEQASFSIQSKPHATIVVAPSSTTLDVPVGQTGEQVFDLDFLLPNDRRRMPVNFTLTEKKGLSFPISFRDTFAQCVKAPPDFMIGDKWNGWERAQVLHADQSAQVNEFSGKAWDGPEDLSASIRTMWDEKYFYIGVRVRDNVFLAEQPPNAMFLKDAVEIGMDVTRTMSSEAPWFQFVAGKSTNGDVLFRHVPHPAQEVKAGRVIVTVVGKGGDADYHIAIPWSEFKNFVPQSGRQIAFGLIVDDGDTVAPDRKFIHWFGKTISHAQPQGLGDIILVK